VDATIIQSGRRRLTLDALRERAARVATGWESSGARDGATIAVMLRNDIAFIECMLAANTVGAYWVPINWHYKVEEVRYILADSRASHLVIHADLLRQVADAIPQQVSVICVATPPEVCAAYGIPAADAEPPGDCCEWQHWIERHPPWSAPPLLARGSMVYTSGTTGRPKGVKRQPVGRDDRRAHAELRLQWFGFRAGMRTAMIGPLYHSVQSTYALGAISAGGSVFVLPKFDPEYVLHLIGRERLTHLHLVPTMMNRLLELPQSVRWKYDLSSLEFVIHGAAPCPKDVKRSMIEWWGPIIHEYYGTSEAGMVSRCSSEEWLQREGTVGKPWPGRIVRIYDESGNILPANVEGEVYMSLGTLPNFTYHNADEKRAAIERDGLITSGDIGYVDADGYLFLCDRKHDTVISGGVNIYPAEIEGVLVTHPAVMDCAVFGIPDEELGEVLAAAVQLRNGWNVPTGELQRFLRARLAGFKVPRRFEIRDALPREDSGKIFKRLLREPYWSQAGRRI